MESLQKMRAQPKIIYTDDEGSISGADFKQLIEDEGIELCRTRSHPAFAERFIRTLKDKLWTGLRIQWIDYTTEILLAYNSKGVHSAHIVLLDWLQMKQGKKGMSQMSSKQNLIFQ